MEASEDTAELRGVSLRNRPRPVDEDAHRMRSMPENTEKTA